MAFDESHVPVESENDSDPSDSTYHEKPKKKRNVTKKPAEPKSEPAKKPTRKPANKKPVKSDQTIDKPDIVQPMVQSNEKQPSDQSNVKKPPTRAIKKPRTVSNKTMDVTTEQPEERVVEQTRPDVEIITVRNSKLPRIEGSIEEVWRAGLEAGKKAALEGSDLVPFLPFEPTGYDEHGQPKKWTMEWVKWKQNPVPQHQFRQQPVNTSNVQKQVEVHQMQQSYPQAQQSQLQQQQHVQPIQYIQTFEGDPWSQQEPTYSPISNDPFVLDDDLMILPPEFKP